MNDSLDDDPRTWPDDPYTLFGVARDVDPRNLRLAYNQLIRRFHPERFPEQFQRIREEYEWLQRAIESRPSDEKAADSVRDEAPILDKAAESINTDQDSTPPPATFSFTASQVVIPVSTDEAWQRACDGELSASYKLIRDVAQSKSSSNGDDALRLFWLLYIQPELDPDRTAMDWLEKAIILNEAGTQSRWLYLHFLEVDPNEAISERCLGIIESIRDHQYRHVLLAHRWRAAADADLWSLIRSDLDRMKATRTIDDPRTWISLHLLVCDFTAWSESSDAESISEDADREIFQTTSVPLDLGSELDRYDLLIGLITECPDPNSSPVSDSTLQLIDLVHRFWQTDADSLRLDAVEQIDGWIESPETSLEFIDQFANVYPMHLAVLFDGLRQLRRDLPRERGDVQLKQQHAAIEEALLLAHRSRYVSRSDFRRDMLRLILSEGVSLDELYTFGPQVAPPGSTRWHCEELGKDLPFQTLITAFEVYWNFAIS